MTERSSKIWMVLSSDTSCGPFHVCSEAKTKAKDLAFQNPGKQFAVYEILEAYCVSEMTRVVFE